MNRRDLLRLGATGGLTSLLPGSSLAGTVLTAGKPKPLRVAHVTDIHALPIEKAHGGFARAMRTVYESKPRPDLILIGGDCVMDASGASDDGAKKQWGEWHAVMKDFDRIPLHPVLGNHDYHWSGDPKGDPLTQREEGAKWALDELGMKARHSTFDAGGWRFLLLDSMTWQNRGYHAELDAPQMEWLKAQIAATPKTMPILVMSHISIFSACGFFEAKTLKGEPGSAQRWEIPTSWMHADAIALKDLFRSHGNVRLCLSGHMHQLDDITMNGTRYVCGGAVCGNWWRGAYYDTEPGITIVDLHPDGRSETKYVQYEKMAGVPAVKKG